MRRFNYDKQIEERAKRRMLFVSISMFFCLIFLGVFISEYNSLSSWEKDKSGAHLIFIVVVMAIGIVSTFVSLMAESVRISCLKTNYLEIDGNKINGVVSKSLKNVDDIDFFSLSSEEIEKLENVSLYNNYSYTLFIHTKHGTYKLCIENVADAIRRIESLKTYGLEETPVDNGVHKWRCSCGKMISSTFCPYCGKDYEEKTITQEGLKTYVENELKKQQKEAYILEFYQTYLDCIYGNTDKEKNIDLLKKVIEKGPDIIDYKYIPVLLESCRKRLNELDVWRCTGCGNLLPIEQEKCSCGFNRQ